MRRKLYETVKSSSRITCARWYRRTPRAATLFLPNTIYSCPTKNSDGIVGTRAATATPCSLFLPNTIYSCPTKTPEVALHLYALSTDVTEPEPEPEPDLIVPVVRSALGVRHSTFIGLYFLRPLHAHCFRPVSFFDGTLTFAQLFPRFERKVLHTSE